MDDDHVCVTITVTTVNVHIFAVFVSWMVGRLLVRCLVVWLFVCCYVFFVVLASLFPDILKKKNHVNQPTELKHLIECCNSYPLHRLQN